MPLAPAEWDSAMAWAAATAPRRHTLIRFRWKYRDAGKSYAGRAAVRMLWAGLGIVRPPAVGAAVFGIVLPGADSGRIWRFVQGEDTLDYRLARGSGGARVLEAEWRRQGKVVARSRAELDVRAMPASARIDFPEGPARFEFTVGSVDTTVAFDSATWRRRH